MESPPFSQLIILDICENGGDSKPGGGEKIKKKAVVLRMYSQKNAEVPFTS